MTWQTIWALRLDQPCILTVESVTTRAQLHVNGNNRVAWFGVDCARSHATCHVLENTPSNSACANDGCKYLSNVNMRPFFVLVEGQNHDTLSKRKMSTQQQYHTGLRVLAMMRAEWRRR